MASIPSSTHVVESAIIHAPVSKVWEKVSSLKFSWWSLVSSSESISGASPLTIGSTHTISFKDGVVWTIQLSELSQIQHSLTFEVKWNKIFNFNSYNGFNIMMVIGLKVIASEPASPVTSTVHTISLYPVTANNSTFIQWVNDFSNDATAEVGM